MSDLSPALPGTDGEDLSPALGGLKMIEVDGYLFDPAVYQIADLPKPERWAHLSATQAQTMRRKIQIANGTHPFGRPLRKPEGETCGTCRRCVKNDTYNKTFYKCAGTTWTKGPGSDLRKKWPACDQWEPAT